MTCGKHSDNVEDGISGGKATYGLCAIGFLLAFVQHGVTLAET